jgi:dihydroxyacetone kinase
MLCPVVLAAIRTVTGPPGCLLIIKNYTGDRLHFGLAAEQAKAEGLSVEMVMVGEDVAIEEPGLAGRRGLAGTVLVQKAAGAAAARGDSLKEVAAVAQRVASSQGEAAANGGRSRAMSQLVSISVTTLNGHVIIHFCTCNVVQMGSNENWPCSPFLHP